MLLLPAAVRPVAEIPVAQLVLDQGDDPILRGAFGLADVAQAWSFQYFPVAAFTRTDTAKPSFAGQFGTCPLNGRD